MSSISDADRQFLESKPPMDMDVVRKQFPWLKYREADIAKAEEEGTTMSNVDWDSHIKRLKEIELFLDGFDEYGIEDDDTSNTQYDTVAMGNYIASFIDDLQRHMWECDLI